MFTASSTIPHSDSLGDELGQWETHLGEALMKGLHSDISARVKFSCVGWDKDAGIAELRRHALHAEKQCTEEKKNTKG